MRYLATQIVWESRDIAILAALPKSLVVHVDSPDDIPKVLEGLTGVGVESVIATKAVATTLLSQRIQMETPWGTAQSIERIAVTGGTLVSVSTASHGGIFVPDELLSRIPLKHQVYAEHFSQSRNWYEEDVAICAVVIAFPEGFPKTPVEHMAHMGKQLEHYIERREVVRAVGENPSPEYRANGISKKIAVYAESPEDTNRYHCTQCGNKTDFMGVSDHSCLGNGCDCSTVDGASCRDDGTITQMFIIKRDEDGDVFHVEYILHSGPENSTIGSKYDRIYCTCGQTLYLSESARLDLHDRYGMPEHVQKLPDIKDLIVEIDAFEKECEASSSTDTGNAWELLHRVRADLAIHSWAHDVERAFISTIARMNWDGEEMQDGTEAEISNDDNHDTLFDLITRARKLVGKK